MKTALWESARYCPVATYRDVDTEVSPWYLPHPLSPGPALGWGGSILVLHLDNCPYPPPHTQNQRHNAFPMNSSWASRTTLAR